jgi:hypothetical protein
MRAASGQAAGPAPLLPQTPSAPRSAAKSMAGKGIRSPHDSKFVLQLWTAPALDDLPDAEHPTLMDLSGCWSTGHG